MLYVTKCGKFVFWVRVTATLRRRFNNDDLDIRKPQQQDTLRLRSTFS